MNIKTIGVFAAGVVVGAAGALIANHIYNQRLEDDWEDVPEPEEDPERPSYNGIPWDELNAIERREVREQQAAAGVKLSEHHAPELYNNIFEAQDPENKVVATKYDKIIEEYVTPEETKPKNKQRRGIEPGRKPKEDNMIEITSEQFIANYDQDVEQRTCTYYVNDQVLGGYNDSLDEMDPDEYGLTRFVDDLFYDPDKGAIYVTDMENGIDYEIVKSLGSFDEEWAELNPDPTAVK